MRWIKTAVACGLVLGAAALRASFAEDAEDAAFDTPAVKELAARAAGLKLDEQISLIRHVQKSIDAALLTPSEDAWKDFGELRNRTDAGLARILERGLFEKIVTPRGGGCYWSFTKRSNDYDKTPQVELQQWAFSSGFHGGDTGLVARLDRAALLTMTESVVPDELRATPDEVAAARSDRRFTRLKAEVGGVYAVRAVDWDESDVLAAFQVIDLDDKGATIAWRLLKTYDVPKRRR